MCGILFVQSRESVTAVAVAKSLGPSGPDAFRHLSVGGSFFAFHRLKINDLSDAGMQPWVTDDFVFMCNGEIYNSDRIAINNIMYICIK